MAHAVSALYSKFNRMSPAAAAMAALLHALVALAFLWEVPRHETEVAEHVIEFTVDTPTTPPAAPEAAPPAPAPQATQAPSPPPPSPPPNPAPRLGLAPPRSLTPDPRAQPAPPQPGPTPADRPTQTTEPPRPEAAKPEPEQQQAAAAPPPPPPPPEPKLEQALPPVEAPPPPLTAQDFPKAAPPPPPKTPPPPPQRAQAPPPPQRQQLQPSPLSTAPQQRAPADSQAAARPSPLTNPASQYGQRKVEDDYLWQVSRILSQHQQFVRNVTTEQGSVVLRMTVARDGRLVDVGLFQSSGIGALDATAVNLIRQAGPYPRLPPEIAGAQHSFVLPLHFRRSN